MPFPESNAVWKVSQTTIAGPIFYYVALCGDTVLGGTPYHQVRGLQVGDQLNITSSSFIGGLRRDGEKVYVLPNGYQSEYLIYDFSLQAGDDISIFSPILGQNVSRHVDSVKMEDLAGQVRKVIYFTPSHPLYPPERWMAGIGSSSGPMTPTVEPGADSGSQLLCFQHGDEYHNEYPPEDCLLPELPAECGLTNAAPAPITIEPLQLTAQPNPAGPVAVRFVINQQQLPEPCHLKVYAANGKLLGTVANAQPATNLPDNLMLNQGFYIATLESERTERVLAHCTFVVGEP
ncbi:MAG: T9SS type A sorting domain-containing protein [Saprospiraceae bacterium]|nr:T9SS type A sorting domain-containing protein [Saprospiraceae bacterium]